MLRFLTVKPATTFRFVYLNSVVVHDVKFHKAQTLQSEGLLRMFKQRRWDLAVKSVAHWLATSARIFE